MKRKITILMAMVITIGFACVFTFKMENSSVKEKNKIELQVAETCLPHVKISEERDESSKDSVELHIDTYEELEKDHALDTKVETKESNSQDTEKEKNTGNSDTTSTKKIVIDESEETMRDETKGTEKEYVAKEEPQEKIELHKPTVTEGKDVTVDTKPGGKRNVGSWG